MRRERKEKHTRLNRIIAVSFCVGLVLVSAANALTPPVVFSENENRSLAQLPTITVDNILHGNGDKSFSEQFDTYASDQFIGRSLFISAKALLEKAVGKWENNGVFFGKDNYLIQAPANDEATIQKEAKNVENNLAAIRQLADSGQYQVTLMLAPTAYEIMQDKLPPYAYRDIQPKLYEQAATALAGSTVQLVDPRETIRSGDGRQLYYRTDHHWTTYGAYLGYTALGQALNFTPMAESEFDIQVLSDEFYGTMWSKATLPDFPADTIEAYMPKSDIQFQLSFLGADQPQKGQPEGLYSYGYLETKDKYSVFLDGNHSLIRVDSTNQNGKTLLVVKDSYAHSLVPFLANHYQTIYLLDTRYSYSGLSDILAQYDIQAQEVLFLYNCENFMSDDTIARVAW